MESDHCEWGQSPAPWVIRIHFPHHGGSEATTQVVARDGVGIEDQRRATGASENMPLLP